MKPMDFEEFLWANSINQSIIDNLKQCIEKHTPVNSFIHQKMLDLFNRYICIGGMPEVVNAYVKSNDFNEVRKIQKRILKSFEADFGTHLNDNNEIVVDDKAKAKIIATFKSIPNQLAKDNQKFQYSVIMKSAKGRDYKTAIEWLEDYGLISCCYNLTLPELPFDSFIIPNYFKIYTTDSGLFIAMLDDDTPDLIINNKLKIAKGAIYENIVADAFSKLGKKLYFYHKQSGLEIDFITNLHKEAVLVEVKAKSGNTKASKEILENKGKYQINKLIKLTSQNIGYSENIFTYPYYLTSFVFKE